MTTWSELRNAVLVGTDRRPLPAGTGPGTPALPTELAPEAAALHHAALLGVRRRAGTPIVAPPGGHAPTTTDSTDGATGTTPHPDPDPGPGPDRPDGPTAPPAATRLLDLVLAGDVVSRDHAPRLLHHWLQRCRATGHVLPHRLLPAILDRGRQSVELRTHLRPVLGSRGRWLASLDDRWSWADAPDLPAWPDGRVDLPALLALPVEGKADALRRLRRRDAGAARALLDQARAELSATERAVALETLAVGLGPDDGPLLDAALDDRSRKVRAVARDLLDGLPSSRRASRLSARLEPLVATGGLLRRSVTVTFPDPPNDHEERDLADHAPPTATIEARWLVTLVAGSPLAWWERTLQAPPAEILRRSLTPRPELVAGWTVAAAAERSTAWAGALLAAGHVDHRLIDLVDEATLVDLVERRGRRGSGDGRDPLPPQVLHRAGPWGEVLSATLLDWAMWADRETTRFPFETPFAANLHPSAGPRIEQLLERAAERQRPPMRRVLHVLSLHTSITEAFS